ncbi:MAG TPA: CPBP family intramembrane glutamic endopeptidase [Gemmatimonadaceae bacterium]|nr:CPBP family intramembrane glutamic endopeptidase [Gemmatimonadaceae bacterium]
MSRSAALVRALLFLLVTSPLWALKQAYAVFHPAAILALALALTLLFLWWDNRSPEVLGLDPKPRRLAELALGFVGAALLVGVIAVVMYFVLPFPWQRNPNFRFDQAAWSLLFLLMSNGVEELVFRGYSFERMISAIGLWPAQIVTALIFAVFHVLHGWSWNAALVGTTLGSILFGLVFVRWRSVPAAVGVHAAGNWMRDLLLSDPPTAKTFFSPVSVRAWTPLEQFTARVVWNGIVVVACVLMTIEVYRHRRYWAASGADA